METKDAELLKIWQNNKSFQTKHTQWNYEIWSIAKKVYCKHKAGKSCLKVARDFIKTRRLIKIDMRKEMEEAKLSYMTKKHGKMKKS